MGSVPVSWLLSSRQKWEPIRSRESAWSSLPDRNDRMVHNGGEKRDFIGGSFVVAKLFHNENAPLRHSFHPYTNTN